jgi:hypothetical protein
MAAVTKEKLKQLLIGAESSHAQYEHATGGVHVDWPEFYAQFMFDRLHVSESNKGPGFGDLVYRLGVSK